MSALIGFLYTIAWIYTIYMAIVTPASQVIHKVLWVLGLIFMGPITMIIFWMNYFWVRRS